MKRKVYLNRQPKVGDMVEAISNPGIVGDYVAGYEYKIIHLRNEYIVVTGDRTPYLKDEIVICDGSYSIFEYQEIPEPKEVQIKNYKFLGIPFGTRTIYVYDK